ncbi:Hypothetical predicted protein [Paramuricea clavata]|uniref:Uncharacterized protein n=1 Tax=Paramuricea clavata TaxID=317549 RepID=A0A6S7FXD5_PARCT|nr:Hypothetical predicted protein [Paramuricea clavata]
MDANFYKFLELSEYPNNIFELNFIKWQLNGKIKTATPSHNNTLQTSPQQVNTTPQYQTSPQQVNTTPQFQTPPQQVNTSQYQTSPQQISVPSPSKVLTADFPPLPVKLAKLKKHVNIVEGQFNAFTLELPRTPEQATETIIIDEKSTTVEPDNKITDSEPTFPSLTAYLEDFMSANEETQIPQVYTTPVKVTHRGKDILAARKSFEEEIETEKKEKKTPARKCKREPADVAIDARDTFTFHSMLQLNQIGSHTPFFFSYIVYHYY